MKNLLSMLVCAVVFSQAASAATKADSILALTGNARTKLVWIRWQWCDANYNPDQTNKAGKKTLLTVFDTDEGTARNLDSVPSDHGDCPRITRKGTHVIWSDSTSNCSWIRDFAGTSPKRRLIDGGDYSVVACQWNSATNEEFVYVLTSDAKTLYRIPLKADYTADLTQKTSIYRSADAMDTRVSVSEDGLYVGTEIPWPNCLILNVTTGERLSRKADGAFGCQPNLAADNSYRFFHLRDDHKVIRMWDPNLGATNWDVTINQGMPGNTADMDCSTPRWSNNVRFFTNGYPLIEGGYTQHWGDPTIFGMSAAQIRADDPAKAGSFCLGKFSQDFKSVEGYVLVSDFDIRHRDGNGDAWIAGSVDNTAPAAPAGLQGTAASESKISLTWNAAIDNESGILEYNVYRGGVRIAVAKTPAYSDSLLRESTDYSYQVTAVNRANMESARSAAVVVRTLADTRPPTIATAAALGKPTEVMVVFSEAVDRTSATTAANYQVSPGMTVSGAAQAGPSVVMLTLSANLTAGTTYTLTVSNVKDTAATPNTIAASSQKTFTYFACGDDFSGASMDAARWTVVDNDGGSSSVSISNGALKVWGAPGSDLSENGTSYLAVRRSDFTGNFDVWTKLVDPAINPNATQQGILIANNASSPGQGGLAAFGLEFNGDMAAAVYAFRLDISGSAGSLDKTIISIADVQYPCWLRLARSGTTVTAYTSITGPYQWREVGSGTPQSMAANSQVCLFSSTEGCWQNWGSTALFDEFGCTVQGVGSGSITPARHSDTRMHEASLPRVNLRKGDLIEVNADRNTTGTVALVSPAGRVIVFPLRGGRTQYALGSHSAGVYFVKITTDAGERVIRALVTR